LFKRFYGLNNPQTYWTVGQDSHKFYFQAPAFVDLLKDFNEMWNRELVNPVIWTGSKNDKWGLLFSGVAAIEMDGDSDNITRITQALQEKFPDEHYMPIPAFGADPSKGYNYTAASSIRGGGNGWAIPKGGKNSLRAAAFVDYIMSDYYQKLAVYGREGEEHTIGSDGMPQLMPEILKLGDGTDIVDKYHFNPLGGSIRNDYWMMIARQQRMPEMKESLDIMKPVLDKWVDLTFAPEAIDIPYPAGSNELKIYSVIKEAFGDEVTRIIQGSAANVERDYADLLKKIEGMGLATLNAYQEAAAKAFSETVKKYKF
jgi:ABC-type glycerol-3-phosphate transport system substrate-binding protein